ncbi:hypothetical protein QFW96_02190 [Saccharopolyspora sp. TS4A08]|uniref:ESX-1 secretion-associated protein n=1 Tax=Saccharopolyspora ipomoeae TaxID=3042027 RepID=A0ABT6PHH8_9PSEU|nr:hypothetical protein [Saccharopolyspora sp. TS4A08]MDI2027397.1 hypothetical protein [Saccharopolyspora sp. TS4A08]
MTVHVLVDELHKSAEATRSGADQARASKLDSATDKIAQALPGSTSAPAASSTGRSWTSSVQSWCRSAGEHVDALQASAEQYSSGDQGAASDLRSAGGR